MDRCKTLKVYGQLQKLKRQTCQRASANNLS